MSWVRIWVHIIFTTKNREPLLNATVRQIVFQHIKQNAVKKEILIDCVNGYSDHVHCLISLKKHQTVNQVLQLIKGESSRWINNEKLLKRRFSWQDDYWAFGVSESHVQTVRRYIHNQEKHHKVKSFSEEIDEFMKKYGWQFFKE
jgi:putative transposase